MELLDGTVEESRLLAPLPGDATGSAARRIADLVELDQLLAALAPPPRRHRRLRAILAPEHDPLPPLFDFTSRGGPWLLRRAGGELLWGVVEWDLANDVAEIGCAGDVDALLLRELTDRLRDTLGVTRVTMTIDAEDPFAAILVEAGLALEARLHSAAALPDGSRGDLQIHALHAPR